MVFSMRLGLYGSAGAVNAAASVLKMDFSAMCAALLLAAAAALILKSFGFKGAPVFTALAIAVFLSHLTDSFSEIAGAYSKIISIADISYYASAAMKVVGIGYLSGISSDICREIGETGIAKCISVAARLEGILISLPFIEDILSVAIEFLET